MAASDLCKLDALRAWIGQEQTGEDGLLSQLISSASGLIYGQINRAFVYRRVYNEVRFGREIGQDGRLLLKQWPVLGVNSVTFDGVAVPAAPAPGIGVSCPTGYYLEEPWDGSPPGAMGVLCFTGLAIPRTAVINYPAGYAVLGEAQTVPATSYLVTVNAPYGPWTVDEGVTLANGTALTKVDASPVAGQYALGSVSGTYQFAAADTGAAVLISYSFTPPALQQSAMEIAAERYKYRSHIGETSQSTQGMRTTSYAKDAISPHVAMLIAPYRNVVPI